MNTDTETTQPEYLANWEGLTLEQVKANSQEIDTVRARCLGSLCAAMFYSFNSLLSIKAYAESGLEPFTISPDATATARKNTLSSIAKRAEADFARLEHIIEEANEMYRRIDGHDLLKIPK